MTDFVGFAASTRSGKLESFGIEKGTTLDDAVFALGLIGFDGDAAASLTEATALAKSRHGVRHPGNGKFVAQGSAWTVTDADLAQGQQEIASTRDAQQAHADEQMARADGAPIFTKHTGATLPLLRNRSS
jgi:hypothetical protein